MAGITFTAPQLNNQAGLLVQSLWTSLEEVRRMKLWLDDATHTDVILQASPYSVAAADLTAIRSSFADLGGTSGLWAVARGSFAPSGASNYFANAKSLTGLSYSA
jgi:hypothetical protein